MKDDLKKLEKLAMMKDDSDLAFMDEAEKTNEHLSEIHNIQSQTLDVLKQIEEKEIIIPEIPKFPTSISISNLPKIQQVEVINQAPAPIVKINVPDVIIPAFPQFPQFPPIPETKISILTKELEDGLITIADVLKEIRGMTEKNGMKEMVLMNYGISAVELKNNAGAKINPATSDNQNIIISAVTAKYITGIGDGRKVVTTAGTALALATTTPCKKVTITAETDNTGIIVVGGTTVVAALATRRGTPLNAGDSYEFDIDDLMDVYIDTTVNGDGVTFSYFT